MIPHEPAAAAGWRATLDLGFERRGDATVLAQRRHVGPLRVQKPLYPEGHAVCHCIVLHPPAGICGGDNLEIGIEVAAGARALATTPGAGKWYRSAGAEGTQALDFRLGPGAALEWLPQESIVFDGARARMAARVELESGACFLGWEVVCLGRRGSGERFTRGWLSLGTRIFQEGEPLWFEQGLLVGGSQALEAPAVLDGASVFGTLVAAGVEIDTALLAACREPAPEQGLGGVTRLPRLLVARYVGNEAEAARRYFCELWSLLRPALLGRAAVSPRIWST
ncbi:MAG TPA: urease accessory protein UreD [Burkholderiales bacterium]|nr:urease accessory protein UreD [Burkholderiales bacterium]